MDQIASTRHMRRPEPPRKPRRWPIKPTEDLRQTTKGMSEDALEDWTFKDAESRHGSLGLHLP